MINIETPTYYTATKKYNLSFPTLEQDIDADVVVIGGGFSGINTALELAEKGITNIVVLEARYLGFGGTGRNGGQIMAGIGHDLEKIRQDVGEAGLRSIFEISDLGADIIKEEQPNGGDTVRALGPFKDGESLLWQVEARNKKSITIDLRKPAGQELLKRLV